MSNAHPASPAANKTSYTHDPIVQEAAKKLYQFLVVNKNISLSKKEQFVIESYCLLVDFMINKSIKISKTVIKLT
jgi:hypothetical protein